MSRHNACPDGGTCHHGCDFDRPECFRVRTCEPLSGVFADDRWPEGVRRVYGEPSDSREEIRRIETGIACLWPDGLRRMHYDPEFKAAVTTAAWALTQVREGGPSRPSREEVLATIQDRLAEERLRRQGGGLDV